MISAREILRQDVGWEIVLGLHSLRHTLSSGSHLQVVDQFVNRHAAREFRQAPSDHISEVPQGWSMLVQRAGGITSQASFDRAASTPNAWGTTSGRQAARLAISWGGINNTGRLHCSDVMYCFHFTQIPLFLQKLTACTRASPFNVGISNDAIAFQFKTVCKRVRISQELVQNALLVANSLPD